MRRIKRIISFIERQGVTPLAKRVRWLRAMRGLSRWKVAIEADVTDGWLGHLEQGDIKEPSPIRLERLAGALGTSYEDLMAAAGYTPVQAIEDDLAEFVHALLAVTPSERRRIMRMVYAYLGKVEPPPEKPGDQWVS